jgi:hypothetical protein
MPGLTRHPPPPADLLAALCRDMVGGSPLARPPRLLAAGTPMTCHAGLDPASTGERERHRNACDRLVRLQDKAYAALA